MFEAKCVRVAVTTFVAKAAFPFLSKMAFIEKECYFETLTFTYSIKFYNSITCSPQATTTSAVHRATVMNYCQSHIKV